MAAEEWAGESAFRLSTIRGTQCAFRSEQPDGHLDRGNDPGHGPRLLALRKRHRPVCRRAYAGRLFRDIGVPALTKPFRAADLPPGSVCPVQAPDSRRVRWFGKICRGLSARCNAIRSQAIETTVAGGQYAPNHRCQVHQSRRHHVGAWRPAGRHDRQLHTWRGWTVPYSEHAHHAAGRKCGISLAGPPLVGCPRNDPGDLIPNL
jgi:hypothetical protein